MTPGRAAWTMDYMIETRTHNRSLRKWHLHLGPRRRAGAPADQARATGPEIAVATILVAAHIGLVAWAWSRSAWFLLAFGLVVACVVLFAFLGYRSGRDLDDACEEIEQGRDIR